MRTPIEAQLRCGGSWKPAELSGEGDAGPGRHHGGDVFDIKADAESDPGLIEAAGETGILVVEG